MDQLKDLFESQEQSLLGLSSGGFHLDMSKVLTSLVTFFAIFIYILNKHTKSTFQRFLYTPPNNFRETLKTATERSGKIPKALIGIKTASLRRRLIMGSQKPLNLSSLPLNSNDDTNNSDGKYLDLRVPQVDRFDGDNRSRFLMNIKPIEPDNVERKIIFGFFHPHSYANGGGERVLWEAVDATLRESENHVCVVYTFADNEKMSVSSLLASVKVTFGVDLFDNDRIVLIHLNEKLKWMIDPKSWKFASLILQTISSIRILFNGLNQISPDVFIDTQGFPFVYSIVSYCIDVPIISYVHYPIISADMLKSVWEIKGVYKYLKFGYWWTMLRAYQLNASFSNFTLCNSTWTLDNVKSGLGVDDGVIDILYPPCVSNFGNEVNSMSLETVSHLKRENLMVYLAQFRPEKRHLLLLKHYAEYVKANDDPYKLILIGSTRTSGDMDYVELIKKTADDLEIPEGLVKFELNAPSELVEQYLMKCQVGLNCMWKEHFGISVVEYGLNGAIPLVHASAGPLSDIVIPWDSELNEESTKLEVVKSERSGLFFKDKSDVDFSNGGALYPSLVEIMNEITKMSEADKIRMRENILHVTRKKFGVGAFSRKWTYYISQALALEMEKRETRGKVERVY